MLQSHPSFERSISLNRLRVYGQHVRPHSHNVYRCTYTGASSCTHASHPHLHASSYMMARTTVSSRLIATRDWRPSPDRRNAATNIRGPIARCELEIAPSRVIARMVYQLTAMLIQQTWVVGEHAVQEERLPRGLTERKEQLAVELNGARPLVRGLLSPTPSSARPLRTGTTKVWNLVLLYQVIAAARSDTAHSAKTKQAMVRNSTIAAD